MRTKRLACGLLIGAVAVVGAALPGSASASDFCVNMTCNGDTEPSLQDALLAAGEAGPDRILLGPGTYVAPGPTGFSYSDPSDPVEIIGSGRGGPEETLLKGQSGGHDAVLTLLGGPGTSVRNLSIELPVGAASGTIGLRTNGTATVTVTAGAQPAVEGAVLVGGGTLENSVVSGGTNGTGVIFDEGGGAVRDSYVGGHAAVTSSYGGVIERSQLAGNTTGVYAYRHQTVVRSTEIFVSSQSGIGIAGYVTPDSDDTVIVDGVNILGAGGGKAIHASNAFAPAKKSTVTVVNSLFRGFQRSLQAEGADIHASYSDYDGSANLASPGQITESHISNAGAAGYDEVERYLPEGSPLIDAGDPSTAQGLDRVGHPLVMDGDHDGVARRDIGALEMDGPLPVTPGQQPQGGGTPADRQAPVLSGFRSMRRAFATRGRFRYSLSEPARVTIKIQRATGGRHKRYRTVRTIVRDSGAGVNRLAFRRRLGKHRLHAGSYKAVAIATDAAHNRSAPRTARFRIARKRRS
jgi:hypothetical protein